MMACWKNLYLLLPFFLKFEEKELSSLSSPSFLRFCSEEERREGEGRGTKFVSSAEKKERRREGEERVAKMK